MVLYNVWCSFSDAPEESPIIFGVADGQTYRMIETSNNQQQLTCGITGGNPLATMSWSCYPGSSTTNITQETVYNTYTWTGGNFERNCTCTAQHALWLSSKSTSVAVELLCKNYYLLHFIKTALFGQE